MPVLRRRKQWAIIGGVIFLLCVVYMAQQLDPNALENNIRTGRVDDQLNQRLAELQYKIKQLEQGLTFNKETLRKVFAQLQSLTSENPHADSLRILTEFIESNQPYHHPISRNVTAAMDTCPALPYDVTKVDKNMMELYDMWSFDDVDGGVWKQGYPLNTNDQEWQGRKLKVFVVPHSHNDPGWIKTYEQYFQQQTQFILNNIVDHLILDPQRRFIWAEMSYLSMWWETASDERKANAKKLISNGQLEIVTGGWVMNDEANTHYFAMIDQMIEGNEWLKNTFNVRPRSGWAIDPFGHTPTMAYLLKKMNFDNMLIQRVHYHVKKQLAAAKSLEFRWRQVWDTNGDNEILCHMMPFYSYDVPHTCGPDPKICCQFDFARLPSVRVANCPWKVAPRAINSDNVRERSLTLLDQYRKKSKLFKTDSLLIILGDDFRYGKKSEIEAQFENYGKIFKYINNNPQLNAHLQFSTLSEYFQSAKDDANGVANFPSLTGDFYTYADREDHYWSGYYVTRPFHKRQERVVESYLRGAEILFSLALPTARKYQAEEQFAKPLYSLLKQARRNLALFQHHDGITGTARDFVVVDYGNRLLQSIQGCQQIMSASARALLTSSNDRFDSSVTSSFEFDEVFAEQNQFAHQRLIDINPNHESQTIVLYNSLVYERNGAVKLLVSNPSVVVMSKDEKISSQINLIWNDMNQPLTDRYELIFLARVPPLGFATYKISSSERTPTTFYPTIQLLNVAADVKNSEGLRHHNERFVINADNSATSGDLVIENNHMKALFSSQNGMLRGVVNKLNGQVEKMSINFMRYKSSRNSKDKSGAYLFLPKGTAEAHISDHYKPVIRVTRGALCSQVDVILPNIRHTVTLYAEMGGSGAQPFGLHVTNHVDIRTNYDNQELAIRIDSDVKSGDRFYTDLNGFDIQPRKYYTKIPLQANFYPMPATAFLQDQQRRMSIMTAQPLGVASLESGQFDVILDRRLMQDDNRGLAQPIKDNVVTPSTFVLLLEEWAQNNTDELAYPSLVAHRLSWELLHPVRTLLSRGVAEVRNPPPQHAHPPCSLHLLNLRSIAAADDQSPSHQSALILHNVGRECRLRPQIQKPSCLPTTDARVQLGSLLPLAAVRPTSLSLQSDGDDVVGGEFVVDVKPMEIEAFRVTIGSGV